MGNRYIISNKHHDNFMLHQQHVDKIALVTEGGGQRGIFTAGVSMPFYMLILIPSTYLSALLQAPSISPLTYAGIKVTLTK